MEGDASFEITRCSTPSFQYITALSTFEAKSTIYSAVPFHAGFCSSGDPRSFKSKTAIKMVLDQDQLRKGVLNSYH